MQVSQETPTVFTVINGWNLRGLPVEEPDRLMHLGARDAHGRSGVSYLDFLDCERGQSLECVASAASLAAVTGRVKVPTMGDFPFAHLA